MGVIFTFCACAEQKPTSAAAARMRLAAAISVMRPPLVTDAPACVGWLIAKRRAQCQSRGPRQPPARQPRSGCGLAAAARRQAAELSHTGAKCRLILASNG